MTTLSTAAPKQSTASGGFLRIAAMKPRRLEQFMVRGQAPDPQALTGREYRGMNLGPWPRVLGIRKFVKGFFVRKGQVFGYNVRARQNRPDDAWLARLSGGKRKRFGFFRVLPVDPESRDNAYLNGLLLDYGQGGTPPLDVTRAIRDYVVRLKPGSDDVLLGKAYMAIGPLRVPLGYFLIERQRDGEVPTERR